MTSGGRGRWNRTSPTTDTAVKSQRLTTRAWFVKLTSTKLDYNERKCLAAKRAVLHAVSHTQLICDVELRAEFASRQSSRPIR
jgi:hypothetical protein